MESYFEIRYVKRAAIANYILLAVYLTISITAHTIANRLIQIAGEPIISAGLIYMSVFVITDIFASYNTRKFVIFMISLEALANLFFIIYTNSISNMPHPIFFHNAAAYNSVFSPIIILYVSNLGGTFISAVIDLFIFFYLYKNRRWPFLSHLSYHQSSQYLHTLT